MRGRVRVMVRARVRVRVRVQLQLVLDAELLERVPLRSWDIARLGVHEGDRRVCELRVVAHLLWLQFEQAQHKPSQQADAIVMGRG